MSSGEIVIKSKKRIDNPIGQNVADIIYELVPTFKVDVEDTKWERMDESIKNEIIALDERQNEKIATLDEKQKEDTEKLDNKITDILENRIKDIDKRLGDNQGNLSNEIETIKKEIENLKARKVTEVIIKHDDSEPQDLGENHFQLLTLLDILKTKLNVYLVGPAGAGKTYAAEKCAEALKVKFYFTGAVASEFKLTGFIDAQGRIVSTQFRKAFENGGVFLFDEIDASYPQAVLAFNAALSNDYMDFPDKRVSRHKDFYCIAAANTYGQGADRQYVGRNQLDAASLDRFVFLDWKYDENLERKLAGNQDWSDYVQKIRRFIEKDKTRHVVSPRASINGAKLLANGIPREIVEQIILWKDLDETIKAKILENITPKRIQASRTCEFTLNVKVGDKVTEGDIIGEIEYIDNIDNSYHSDEIKTEFSGTIISILGFNQVEENEVIAEIDCYGD
jgi:MoxR-like ATPase/gas vesicle protein